MTVRTIASVPPAPDADDLLRELLNRADLLGPLGPQGQRYLLVEVPPALLDALEQHGADTDDVDDSELDDDASDLGWVPDWRPWEFPPSTQAGVRKATK